MYPVHQNQKEFIDEYREADFTRRLHIYLQFPLLRSDFMAIDRSDLNGKEYWNNPGRYFLPAASVQGWLRLALGRLKGLFGIRCGQASAVTNKR